MAESHFPTTAVLLVGHGTVTDLDDLPEFLLRIRRGRPVPPELVSEVRARYEAVGGSPLLDITRAQARALENAIGRSVFVAMRLWHPFIEETLDQILAQSVDTLCVLPVAPFSVHVYGQATGAALARLHDGGRVAVPRMVTVDPWGTEPALIEAHADLIRASGGPPDAALVLTAHSLPVGVVRGGDPYQKQFERAARDVLGRLDRDGEIAYQSQGADGGDWIGPDLKSTLEALRDRGHRHVVVAPIGFLADHVETLYDLDVEARRWAEELGLGWTRVPALNTHPGLVRAMAAAVERALS